MAVTPYKTKNGIKFLIRGKNYFKRGFESKEEALIYEAQHYKIPSKKFFIEMKCESFFKSFKSYLDDRYRMTTVSDIVSKYQVYIAPFFKDLKLKEINNITLRNFNDKINSLNYKNKSHILCYAKVYLRFLEEFSLIDLDYNLLFVKKKNVEIEGNKFDYYTLQEFQLFISGSKDEFDRLFFSLIFFLGLRLEEVRGIKWRDLENGRLFIRRSLSNRNKGNHQTVQPCKTSSSVRDYKLPNFLIELFEDYRKSKHWKIDEDDFIFANIDGRVLTENPIRNRQRVIEKKMNIRHIKIHAFRHSCATLLFNDGFEIEQVASWLGHDSPATTLKYYAHLLPKKKDIIADFFEKITHSKK